MCLSERLNESKRIMVSFISSSAFTDRLIWSPLSNLINKLVFIFNKYFLYLLCVISENTEKYWLYEKPFSHWLFPPKKRTAFLFRLVYASIIFSMSYSLAHFLRWAILQLWLLYPQVLLCGCRNYFGFAQFVLANVNWLMLITLFIF